MHALKTVLVTLITASAGLAAITGRVTDTSGTVPISGAIVRLESGGQTDTTDAKGDFTLLVGTTGINNRLTKAPKQTLSATLQGKCLRLEREENGEVKIADFDLNGKLISSAIPKATDAMSTKAALSKSAKTTGDFHDVLTVEKDGTLDYRIIVTNQDSIKKFGALYNWPVVDSANPKKIAPAGWHVPSKAEWDTLITYLVAIGYNWDGSKSGLTTGSRNKIAKALSAKTDWRDDGLTAGRISTDLSKNNQSGFSALPGSLVAGSGVFPSATANDYGIGLYAVWWSSTELSPGHPEYGAFARELYWSWEYTPEPAASNEDSGYSVRLIKDP